MRAGDFLLIVGLSGLACWALVRLFDMRNPESFGSGLEQAIRASWESPEPPVYPEDLNPSLCQCQNCQHMRNVRRRNARARNT